MKKTRKLIPAIAMLLTSTVMMSTASFAWFSINDTVQATGISVEAKTDGSLVIDSNATVEAGIAVDVSSQNPTPGKLNACTYNTTAGKYQYSDGTGILASTGLNASGSAELKNFTEEQESGYYLDYIVYIAAAGQALTNQTLKVFVDFGSDIKLYQYATSVAFTINTTASGTDLTADDHGYDLAPTKIVNAKGWETTKTSIEETLVTGVDIPLNTSNTSLSVVMRVYFDGALLQVDDETDNTKDKAYVRSEAVNVSTEAVPISVSFKLA